MEQAQPALTTTSMFNSGTAWYATTIGSRRIGRCVQVAIAYKATQQLMATTIILEMEGTVDQTLHLAATS